MPEGRQIARVSCRGCGYAVDVDPLVFDGIAWAAPVPRIAVEQVRRSRRGCFDPLGVPATGQSESLSDAVVLRTKSEGLVINPNELARLPSPPVQALKPITSL
jgi:hypothetical protein